MSRDKDPGAGAVEAGGSHSPVGLTHRQADVMATLLDLYLEADEQPISYRAVAERLGVAPATAYRMIRIAEAKGHVVATYAPPGRSRSPGRATVLFSPSAQAHEMVNRIGGGSAARADWEATKTRILEAVQQWDEATTDAVVGDLLASLQESSTPLATAATIMAAMMVGLEESQAALPDRDDLVGRLSSGGGRLGLAMLGGMLLGLTWADRTGRQLHRRLDSRLDGLPAAIGAVPPESRDDLVGLVGLVARTVRSRRRPG